MNMPSEKDAVPVLAGIARVHEQRTPVLKGIEAVETQYHPKGCACRKCREKGEQNARVHQVTSR